MICPNRSQKAAEGRKSKTENKLFMHVCPIGLGSAHPNPRLAAQKGILKLFFFFNAIHVNSLACHIIGSIQSIAEILHCLVIISKSVLDIEISISEVFC